MVVFFFKLFLVLIIILFLHRTVQRDTRKMFYPVNLWHQKYFLSSWIALITHRSHKLTSALVTAVIQITQLHKYKLLPCLLLPDSHM